MRAAHQGTCLRAEVTRNRTVPTPDAKEGLFRWKSPGSATVQSLDIVAADPRKLGIDKEVAKNLALLPDPNNYDIGDGLNAAGFRFNNPAFRRDDQFTVRGDYILTSNNGVSYRHSWARYITTDTLNNADPTFPGQSSGTQGTHPWGVAVGSDWTINPRVVNEFRYGHQDFDGDFTRPREKRPLILSNLSTNPLTTAFPRGRNAFRGPRSFNIDLPLVKRFRISENHAISFRAGAYNALNNTNFGGLGINIAVPASFRKFSGAVNSARVIQMALRYDF